MQKMLFFLDLNNTYARRSFLGSCLHQYHGVSVAALGHICTTCQIAFDCRRQAELSKQSVSPEANPTSAVSFFPPSLQWCYCS